MRSLGAVVTSLLPRPSPPAAAGRPAGGGGGGGGGGAWDEAAAAEEVAAAARRANAAQVQGFLDQYQVRPSPPPSLRAQSPARPPASPRRARPASSAGPRPPRAGMG